MKVAVPTMGDGGLDELICAHFGRAETFTIVDVDAGDFDVVRNTSEHMGGTGLPPEMISARGAQVMLAGGLGPKAVKMFERYGIEVFIGATGTVRDAIADWKEGRLEEASDENACREHRH